MKTFYEVKCNDYGGMFYKTVAVFFNRADAIGFAVEASLTGGVYCIAEVEV